MDLSDWSIGVAHHTKSKHAIFVKGDPLIVKFAKDLTESELLKDDLNKIFWDVNPQLSLDNDNIIQRFLGILVTH